MIGGWWPGIVYVPAALVVLAGSLSGLSALVVFWRRAGEGEALRLAQQIQAQQRDLITAQHDTNADIDRRLREATTKIEELKQVGDVQEERMMRMRHQHDLNAAQIVHLERLLRLAIGHIRLLTDELLSKGHHPPPLPPELEHDFGDEL